MAVTVEAPRLKQAEAKRKEIDSALTYWVEQLRTVQEQQYAANRAYDLYRKLLNELQIMASGVEQQ
jgi:hypothetical protein